MTMILNACLPAWIVAGMVLRYVVHTVIVKITRYTWAPYWPSVPTAWEPEEALPMDTRRGGRFLLPLFLAIMAASINLPVGLAQIVQVAAFWFYVQETAYIAFEGIYADEDERTLVDLNTTRLAYFATLAFWPIHLRRVLHDLSRVLRDQEPDSYVLLPLISTLEDAEEQDEEEVGPS